MFGSSEAFAEWLRSFGPIPPVAVPIADAQKILGGKSRSQIYEAIGRGELVAVKDGNKTLITTELIKGYVSRLKPAQIKPPPKRDRPWPAERAKARASQSTRAVTKRKVRASQIGPEAA